MHVIHLTKFQVASQALPLLVAGKLTRQVHHAQQSQYRRHGSPCVIGCALSDKEAAYFDGGEVIDREGNEVYAVSRLINMGHVTTDDKAWIETAQRYHDCGRLGDLEAHLIAVLP